MRLNLLMIATVIGLCVGCSKTPTQQPAVSATGVQQTIASVKTDSSGHTTEQNNIIERLKRDNEPGAVKHLYLISAYSGQVLIYSTVKGKVTSSGKRLTPNTMAPQYHSGTGWNESGSAFNTGNGRHYTGEVIQDDGTYGNSMEYLYWFTPDGRYMQTYVSGGTLVFVADQPVTVKGVVMNLEITEKK